MCSAPRRRWEEREMNLINCLARVGAVVAAVVVAVVASFATSLVASAAGPDGNATDCVRASVHENQAAPKARCHSEHNEPHGSEATAEQGLDRKKAQKAHRVPKVSFDGASTASGADH